MIEIKECDIVSFGFYESINNTFDPLNFKLKERNTKTKTGNKIKIILSNVILIGTIIYSKRNGIEFDMIITEVIE